MLFFSACYKFAIQAKKNKHPDSATDIEVPWLDVVPKPGLPPDPLLFTSGELFLVLRRCGTASFPTLPTVFLTMGPCGWRRGGWTTDEYKGQPRKPRDSILPRKPHQFLVCLLQKLHF